MKRKMIKMKRKMIIKKKRNNIEIIYDYISYFYINIVINIF